MLGKWELSPFALLCLVPRAGFFARSSCRRPLFDISFWSTSAFRRQRHSSRGAPGRQGCGAIGAPCAGSSRMHIGGCPIFQMGRVDGSRSSRCSTGAGPRVAVACPRVRRLEGMGSQLRIWGPGAGPSPECIKNHARRVVCAPGVG